MKKNQVKQAKHNGLPAYGTLRRPQLSICITRFAVDVSLAIVIINTFISFTVHYTVPTVTAIEDFELRNAVACRIAALGEK